MRTFIETLDSSVIRINQNNSIKKILQFLLQEGAKTIPEIKDFSRLSLPTTTKLINDLVEQKLLVEAGKRESSGGRPPTSYGLNAIMGYIIGVELLLKSFRMSIINLSHEVIYEYETDNFDISKKEETFQFLISSISNIVERRHIDPNKILGIGIGITGRVDTFKGVSYSYLNYEESLVKKLNNIWKYPVFIDNDTHLMAIGEQRFGIKTDKKNILFINLSRGLGCTLISNGIIYNGEFGFAGEFGHIPFEENNIVCVCGKKGCLETVVSGIALENQYRSALGLNETVQFKNILPLVQSGDETVIAILNQMGENLGKALSVLVQVLNPGLIIIGGHFVQVGYLMLNAIQKGLIQHSLPQLISNCELRVSALGEKTTMLGAYSLVIEKVFE